MDRERELLSKQYEEEYRHLVDRDFPERLLKPWRARVESEAPGWKGTMAPLGDADDSEAFYAIERKDKIDGISRVVRMSGQDQGALIAHTLDIGWQS